MANTIKNLYTFSGQDVRVFVYRDLSRLRAFNNRSQNLAEDKNDIDKLERLTAQQIASMDAYEKLNAKAALAAQSVQDPTNFNVSRNDPASVAARAKGHEEAGKAALRESQEVLNRNKSITGVSPVQIREEIISHNSGVEDARPFFELGTLDSLAFSSFREKIAIRSLGRSHALGYTRGARTIAGALTFNSMQENELLEFFANRSEEKALGNLSSNVVMLDQVAPFNVIILFSNEFGGNSIMQLYNVELASESQRMSVHDLVIQNNMNFYATDMIPMKDVGNTFKSTSDMLYGLATQSNDQLTKQSRAAMKKTVNSTAHGTVAKDLLDRSRGLF